MILFQTMKPFHFYLLTACTLIGKSAVYGQSKNQPVPFPTYNQIKPATTDVFDYVPQQPDQDFNKQQVDFKPVDYPYRGVIYSHDIKPATNTRYVKKVMNQAENKFDGIYGKPSAEVNRVMQLFFIPIKKD